MKFGVVNGRRPAAILPPGPSSHDMNWVLNLDSKVSPVPCRVRCGQKIKALPNDIAQPKHFIDVCRNNEVISRL